jgi:thiamine kinase-like enzyme
VRIGIDLDNTIIFYENVFREIAKASGLVPEDWKGGKEQLREAIRNKPNGEHLWQQLQGRVYSEGIQNAEAFPGVLRFLWRAKHKGHQLFIFSHKTESPHHDSKINLRDPAIKWLEQQNLYSRVSSSLLDNVYFSSTQKGKIEKINELRPDIIIDDLIEIVEHPLLNDKINRIHFGKEPFSTWGVIENHVLGAIDESDCSNFIKNASLGTLLSSQPYNSGGNSSVWKVEIENSPPLAIKFYHNDLARKDRRIVEEFSLERMRQYGVSNIPHIVTTDKNVEASIFRHIEAHVVSELDISKIEIILDFIQKLKVLKESDDGNFPLASAACLSGEDIARQIKFRLLSFQQAREINHDLNEFLAEEFNPFFKTLIEWAKDNWPKGSEFSKPLDIKNQILTPSDLGAHNMLENDKGEIYFIDFEYFGLDDPAKTVSDFLLQPKNKINMDLGRVWVSKMAELLSKSDPEFLDRLAASWPLYGLCWSLIMLNEYRADNWYRRKQSKGYVDSEYDKVKTQQLCKATELLNFIKSNYEEFPYSEIRVN